MLAIDLSIIYLNLLFYIRSVSVCIFLRLIDYMHHFYVSYTTLFHGDPHQVQRVNSTDSIFLSVRIFCFSEFRVGEAGRNPETNMEPRTLSSLPKLFACSLENGRLLQTKRTGAKGFANSRD